MIDIQPYLDKLDKLREYMFMKIDGYGLNSFWIDYNALPEMSPNEIMRIWQQQGVLMYRSQSHIPDTKFKQLSFDEWIETQAHTTLQIKQ